jgi:hypothetical protein
MPTRLKVKDHSKPVEITEPIGAVVGWLNQARPTDWLIFTKTKGAQVAFKAEWIKGVAEVADAVEEPAED